MLYQLSYLAPAAPAPERCDGRAALLATPTGLEPATSAVTGRRANQLRYGASCGADEAVVLWNRWYVPPTGFEPVLPL